MRNLHKGVTRLAGHTFLIFAHSKVQSISIARSRLRHFICILSVSWTIAAAFFREASFCGSFDFINITINKVYRKKAKKGYSMRKELNFYCYLCPR